MVAAEDWMMPVKSVENSRAISGLSNATSIERNAGLSCRPLIASLIAVMPYIRTAKPTMILPRSCRLVFLDIMIRTAPMIAMTGEKFFGFSSSIRPPPSTPVRVRIQLVTVVPMLEPIRTLIVCGNSIRPELTRPTSMTVIADEDWIATVMPAPSPMPRIGLDVAFLKDRSKEPPAILPNPPDMTCMP